MGLPKPTQFMNSNIYYEIIMITLLWLQRNDYVLIVQFYESPRCFDFPNWRFLWWQMAKMANKRHRLWHMWVMPSHFKTTKASFLQTLTNWLVYESLRYLGFLNRQFLWWWTMAPDANTDRQHHTNRLLYPLCMHMG